MDDLTQELLDSLAGFFRQSYPKLMEGTLRWDDVPTNLLNLFAASNPRVVYSPEFKPLAAFSTFILASMEEKHWNMRHSYHILSKRWKNPRLLKYGMDAMNNCELAERWSVRLRKAAIAELERRQGAITALPDSLILSRIALDFLQMRHDGNTAKNFPDYEAVVEPHHPWPDNSENSNVVAQFIRTSYTLLQSGEVDWDAIPSDVLQIVLTDNTMDMVDSPSLAFIGLLYIIGLENFVKDHVLNDGLFTSNEQIITAFVGFGNKRGLSKKWLKKARKAAQAELDRRTSGKLPTKPIKPFWELAEEFFEDELKADERLESTG